MHGLRGVVRHARDTNTMTLPSIDALFYNVGWFHTMGTEGLYCIYSKKKNES
jgi:hypothetical protein